MTKLTYTLIIFFVATSMFAQKTPKSPSKQVTGTIGDVAVEMDYSAPSARQRTIWGELVPYNKVWRAGANKNTTLSFDKDVKIKGNTIPSGKYGFFIIPTDGKEWTVILSKKNDAWGSNGYDEKNDLTRFTVNINTTEKNQELMTFKIFNKGIQFSWVKTKFFIPIN